MRELESMGQNLRHSHWKEEHDKVKTQLFFQFKLNIQKTEAMIAEKQDGVEQEKM